MSAGDHASRASRHSCLKMGRMLLGLSVVVLAVTSSAAFNLPLVPKVFNESDEVLSAISSDLATKFSDEYDNYLRTGVESPTLRSISEQLANSHSKKDIFVKNAADLSRADKFFLCTACQATLNVIVGMFRKPGSEFFGPLAALAAKKVMLELCHRFKLQTQEVCSGLFDINFPILHYIVMNSVADSRSICGILPISFCEVKQEDFNWTVQLNTTLAPEDNGPKADVPQKTDNDLKILQITDIHYDPEYLPGSLAECEEPLCCRRIPDSNVTASARAGYWSDYRYCDAPLHMIENALEHIKETHKDLDYIYLTGDIIPHSIWLTSKQGNEKELTEFYDYFAKKFNDIPIYPIVGNHEPHPVNVFGNGDVPPEMSISWLYELLYKLWSRWLPTETKETILRGGYYTVTPKPGFRLIVLNNMDCYLLNWWVFQNGSISKPQLDWMHNTLLAAEQAGEYVHILAHIPSGDPECWTVWSREYNRIIVRFSHIIGAIFNGHTHKDEMNLHYSSEGHAKAISWNGGSLTAFEFKNPNYRIYEVEPKTMQVVDHETWIFNLTEANEHGANRSPIWFKEYDFREFTDDLSPAGIDNLLEKMATQPALLRRYYRYKETSADPKIKKGCNKECLLATICRLATTVYSSTKRCNELKAKLTTSLAAESAPSATPSTPPPSSSPGGSNGAANGIGNGGGNGSVIGGESGNGAGTAPPLNASWTTVVITLFFMRQLSFSFSNRVTFIL